MAISAEASREKTSARGTFDAAPVVGAAASRSLRAAVYGALGARVAIRAERGERMTRKNLSAGLTPPSSSRSLCRYPGTRRSIREAQAHLLEAHAERLTGESLEAHG